MCVDAVAVTTTDKTYIHSFNILAAKEESSFGVGSTETGVPHYYYYHHHKPAPPLDSGSIMIDLGSPIRGAALVRAGKLLYFWGGKLCGVQGNRFPRRISYAGVGEHLHLLTWDRRWPFVGCMKYLM